MQIHIFNKTVAVKLLLVFFAVSIISSVGTSLHPAAAKAASYTGTWASGPTKSCPVAGGNSVNVPAVMAITGLAGSWTCVRLSGNQHQMVLESSSSVSSCNPSDKGSLQVGNPTSTNPKDWYDQALKATLTLYQGSQFQCNANTLTDAVTLANTFASVASTSTSSSGSSSGSSGSCSDPCPVPCGSQMRWLTCFLTLQISAGLGAINNLIGSLLDVPVNIIFNDQTQIAFNTFRNLGIGLLVIMGLIMVIAQSSGSELFAAYTVRKALPRIVIAAIGIALAWPLLQFTITLFNDLGNLVGRAILQVGVQHNGFGGAGNAVGYVGGQLMASFLAPAILLAIVATLTVGGMLSLFLSAILMLLTGLIVLALRQIIILICILLAPIAIAAYVLPSTERFWKFWQNTLLTTLIMQLLIMAFLAAGEAMSSIVGSASTNNPLFGVIALLLYVAPYPALIFAARMAGGLMGQVISLAQGFHGQNIEGRLRQYRSNERKWLHQQRMEGRDNGLGFERFGLGQVYRRFGNRGGVHLPGGGREERFQQAERKRMGLIASKTQQEDQNFAGGDDLATELGMRQNMTRAGFLAEYSRRYLATAPAGTTQAQADFRAEQALAALQSSMNSDIGTANMVAASFKAHTLSTTGWTQIKTRDAAGNLVTDYDANLRALRDQASALVNAGVMTEADAIMTIKANKARLDIAGIGWGNWQKFIRNGEGVGVTAAQQAADQAAGRLSMDDIRAGILNDNGPGALIGARPEAVQALSEAMTRRVQKAARTWQAAIGTANEDTTHRALMQALASTAGLHDVMAQIAPSNAKVMANEVLNQLIPTRTPGVTITIERAIEDNRPDDEFMEMRREWGGAARAGYQATAAQAAAAAIAGGAPGAGGPPPGAGGGAVGHP